MNNENAQDYKAALPLIKGLVWWGGCAYKGLIMHSRDCHTAAMLSVDMTFLLITNSGSNTFSYSSLFSSNTINKKL